MTTPSAPNESPKADGETREPLTAIALIRRIKGGELSSKNLSPEDRRLCVAHLKAEGISISETAEVLQVSERTIARDRKHNYESNAIARDPRLAGEVAGRAMQEAENVINHLRRVAREKHASSANKIEAERAVWDVTRQLAQILQSLGFLPTAAHEINARLMHSFGEPLTPEGALAELERLLRIQKDAVKDDEQSGAVMEHASQLIQSAAATINSPPPTDPSAMKPEDDRATQS